MAGDWLRLDDLRGWPIDCGHHLAEEAPAELAATLRDFFCNGEGSG